MSRLPRTRWKLAVPIVLVGLVLGVVAAGQVSAASGDKLTGAPINIGFIGAYSNPAVSVPNAKWSGLAAAKAINDSGGINGRPLNLTFCDDQGSPSVAASCARTLVDDDHIIAFTGNFTLDNASVYPISKPKGIVNFGVVANQPADIDNPLAYFLHPTSTGFAAATYYTAKKYHAKTAVLITEPGFGSFSDLDAQGFKNAGAKVTTITIPPNTTDWGPLVGKLKQLNPDVWSFLVFPPTGIASLVQTATSLGIKAPVTTCDCTMTNAGLQALSNASFPNTLAIAFGADPAHFPVWKLYTQQVAKYAPQASENLYDGDTVNAWLSVYDFAQVAKKIPNIDAASFRHYLEKQTAFQTGLTPPLDFTKPGPVPTLPREQNYWAYPGTAKDGKEVQVSDTPIEGVKAAVPN